jgi:transaldolase
VFEDLAGLGIHYDDVVEVLEVEGVQKFADSWKELLNSVTRQLAAFGEEGK